MNMFNVGDCVEVSFEGQELLNVDKQVSIQGSITRINELGCFVKITYIKTQNSLLLGGQTYHVGDEVYIMNNALRYCALKETTKYHHKNNTFGWGWLALFMI